MKNNYKRWKFLAWIIVAIIIYILAVPAHAATIITNHTPQQQQITGTVTGEDNLPLPGVTVSVKGEARGTVTSFEGEYSITAGQGETLVFSFLGYKKQEIPVGNQTRINVQLEEDVDALDAVKINAGYYNTTRRESTGNISRVTAEEIENQPVISPIQALQGRMAGVEVTEQNGVPGAAPTIRIRGQNSLRSTRNDNGNLPLYIIDGVPVNSAAVSSINQSIALTGTDPLNGLDLSNIKTIEILKDADATAIYGSRGANGVVLITTKNGGFYGGKDHIQFNFYSGISRVSHFIDLLDTREYLTLRRQAFENDGVEPTNANAKDLLLWDQDRYTNWQEILFGNSAPTLNAGLNYSGGGENTSFNIGASYFKQGSVFPGDYSFEKKTLHLSLNHQSNNQKFRTNLSLNYGVNDNNLFSSTNFVSTALNLPPNAPEIYREDGSLNWENSTWSNPLASLQSEGNSRADNIVANIGLEYQVLKNFTLKTNLGYTYLDSEENILLPKEIYDPALWERVSNRSQHSFISRKSWIAEPQLVYNTSIKEHHIDALVGATFQQSDNSSLSINGTGYTNRHLIGNLEAADAVATTQDRDLMYKYSAIFARIGYNWNQTYFLNLTGRRDGSSRFGPDNRFANFGAVGAAWIFSNYQFTNNNFPFMSFGKIRGSYGITGNDQIGDYRYLDAYESTPGPGGLYPTQLTNPSFSWETNKKVEAALELGFFQDRINLNVSWYKNRSSNQLVGYNLPAITGFNTVEANLPATVQNSGLEIEVSALNVKNQRFQWRSSLNLTVPSNKLIRFEGIEQSPYANTYQVGKPLDLAILYQFDGVNPETGLFQVVDVNQDGIYDYSDRVISSNLGRKFYGGFNNQFNYQNFSLGFLFEFVKQQGNKIYNSVPGFMGNVFEQEKNGWTQENPGANMQRASQSISALISYINAYSSNYGLTDASYVRLKTLSLSYNFPGKLLEKVNLAGAQLFMHAQNLFTVTNYQGLDPQNPGVISLPSLQTITGGIQVNF
ncbi:SusC/RagA family TonB-linked outer membrane protein [Zunongwangia sp. F363]|uniref:SusC/RagA family TonB-linked outer membrane protein n=1 Tax=Autumnicola tepida TaxID=3075595 RepID=A0ABU3C7C9_9FLAO|nr:SusC/RagA family TonB-linked outer membrane protein [Zunongwangia sp. F363]MDT0642178.1 SusC/RagA family TonB-linked outer membrane protein [Zunongwangia sp. F363]